MKDSIVVDYYTDVLCVWAWIAQRRVEELQEHFGEAVRWRHRYLDVFGDTAGKINSQWGDRGLHEGFCAHVVEAAAPYEFTNLCERIWKDVRPATSGNAHLMLKAIEATHSIADSTKFAITLRRAFFCEGQNIADHRVLFDLAATQGLDQAEITHCIGSGTAMAALMCDYQSAKNIPIKGSPSYYMDDGRQILYGNVGYRVLRANIEETLRQPSNEASWC